MADLFSFQSDIIDSKKFKTATEINPVLFSNSENPEIYFLVEHSPSPKGLRDLQAYIEGNFSLTYKIISCLPFKPSEKDLKKAIIELYGLNSIDLSKYIKPYSKVITIGRALYGITKSDDLTIDGFYDTIQWKTSFYAPDIKSQVFPVPFMNSWLGKDTFENYFVKKQVEIALKHTITPSRSPKPNLELVNDCDAFLDKWMDYDGVTAWDLETKRLDPWSADGRIICLTLAFQSEIKDLKAYYLPWNKINIAKLNQFFHNKKLIGNNSKYDVKWSILKGGIERDNLEIFWDNMNGSHAINEMQYNSLKSDAWTLTPFGGYDLELELYKIRYPKCKEDYSLIPQSVMFPYATMDALEALLSYNAQLIEISLLDSLCPLDNGWSIMRALREVTIPAINMFVDIELSGMFYDWNKLKKLSDELIEEIARRRNEIHSLLNIPQYINIDSGDQLGRFLESIGWEDPGRSEKGLYLTNVDSWIYWKKKGHKEVDLIEQYVECVTIMKTFVGVEKDEKGKPTGYYQYRKSDGKLHGNFAVMMAGSCRGKSYDPNLQNVVKNSTVKLKGVLLHERVRECFCVPDGDYVLSENDASGLQLRIGATLSKDKTMHDIFNKYGGDMHSITGNQIFCPEIPLDVFLSKKKDKPYKDYRKKAKGANFSLEFGSAAFAFAKSTLMSEWSLDEARDYVYTYKLIDRQKKLFQILCKDLEENPDIKDRKCFIQDQLDFSFYWASAEDIRTKFFKTYEGLAQWHKDVDAFATKHGYVQSVWGPIRRLPQLTYQGKGDNKGDIKNLYNIAKNSPVQTFESFYMQSNGVKVHKFIKDNKLKSYLIGNVHDSFISYIHRQEMSVMQKSFTDSFHNHIDLMGDIPYLMEGSFCDYSLGEWWGVKEQSWF